MIRPHDEVFGGSQPLTKREYLASQALIALAHAGVMPENWQDGQDAVAAAAVSLADALIKRLNK